MRNILRNLISKKGGNTESENKVLACRETPYNGQYFLIVDDKKRWISSSNAAKFYNIPLEDVKWIGSQEMQKIEIGAPIYEYAETFEKNDNAAWARAFLAKDLVGAGIEIGPGVQAYPIPITCKVKYADLFDDDAGCKTYMEGEFAKITYKTGINELAGIKDSSLDFIVHCHVIEHTPDPIGAIEVAYRKLKKNGVLIFAVPDKQVTFDKKRNVTELVHLIEDYRNPDKKRDVDNLVDFLVNATDKNVATYESLKGIFNRANQFIEGEIIDLHYHTFTKESFDKILSWISDNTTKWAEYETFSTLPFSNEFYVRLSK